MTLANHIKMPWHGLALASGLAQPASGPGPPPPNTSRLSSHIPYQCLCLALLVFHSSVKELSPITTQCQWATFELFSDIIRDDISKLSQYFQSRIFHDLYITGLQTCHLPQSKSPVSTEPFLTGLFIPHAKEIWLAYIRHFFYCKSQ